MKTNLPFIFIHILHEELTLAITSNDTAFVTYRGQKKIFVYKCFRNVNTSFVYELYGLERTL